VAVHRLRHAPWEGVVLRKCDSLWKGRGKDHVWRYTFL